MYDLSIIDEFVQPLPEPAATLVIRGATLYTGDARGTMFERATIVARHGTITFVGAARDAADFCAQLPPGDDTESIDADGAIVMPGFVDPHYHEIGPYRFLQFADAPANPPPYPGRGFDLAGDVERLSALFADRPLLAPRLGERQNLIGALFGAWQMLQRGVTTYADFGSVLPGDVLALVAHRVGLNMRAGLWASDLRLDHGTVTRAADAEQLLAELTRVIDAVRELDPFIGAMPSGLMMSTCSDELLRGIAALARQHATPWALHLSAVAAEDELSNAYFGQGAIARGVTLGVVDTGLIAAHTAYGPPEDLAMLAERAVKVTHSPAKYGSSGENVMTQPKWLELLAAGVDVSVSCDAEVFPIGGPVEAMRAAWFGTNVLANDAGCLAATGALEMASLAGARALGWADHLGSVEVGKRCDLTVVRADDWRYVGAARPLDTFLHLGSSVDIDTVVSAGRVVVANGTPTYIDADRLAAAFHETSRATAISLGMTPADWASTSPVGQRRDRRG